MQVTNTRLMQEKKWQMADVLDYALLKNNAKANRQAMTEAEKVFWSVAKSNGMGEKCRRQYIIGTYIVDFFFRSSMLIVEIDGGYHSTVQQQMMDSQRQEYLESKGCKVLRLTNEEVLFQLDKVIEIVKKNLTSSL